MIQQYSADYLRQIDKIDWQNPVNWNHPLNNGLVSWWLAVPNHLGFGTISWLDLCVRNDGVLYDTTMAEDWGRRSPTQSGIWGGLYFNGVPKFVSIPDKNYGIANGYTIAVTYRSAFTPSAIHQIFSRDFSAGARRFWQFREESSGVIGFLRFNSSNSLVTNITGATNVRGSDWHRIVATFTGSGSFIYIDGVLDASDSVTIANRDGTGAGPAIGSQSVNAPSSHLAGGSIASVQFFNRGFSAVDALEDYQQSRSYYPSLLNRNRIKRYFIPSGGGGVTATASGSGSGTGSVAATVVINAVATGSGSGTGAATATVDIQASASGSGSGTGAAVVTPTVTGSATGSGSGTGAATAVVTINATASGLGSGDGAATATVQITGVASGSGGGTGAATATITISATATGSGSGTGVVIVSGVPVVYDVTIAIAAVGAVAMGTPVAVGAVAITLGAEMHHVGDTLKITGTFTLDGTETDPTSVSLQVRDPSGTITLYNYPDDITKEATGIYSYNLLLTQSGNWLAKFVGEGDVVSATEDKIIKVERTKFDYPPG